MQIAICSDTHVPSRAQSIPEAVRELVESADHVIHAGDFDSKGTIADMRDLAQSLTAVRGNMDPAVGLPEVATVELGGVEFVVTHGTGPTRGYEDRVASIAREHASAEVPDGEAGADRAKADRGGPIAVAGHTHEMLDTTRAGVRLLNPGSATGAPPASRPTMMTATVQDGEIDVQRHEL